MGSSSEEIYLKVITAAQQQRIEIMHVSTEQNLPDNSLEY